jgi:transposase-like protein
LKEIKAFEWEGDLQRMTQQTLKKLLEEKMELELTEFLGLEPYNHSEDRRDYRNGYYTRQLLTKMGNVELSVPRVRQRGFYPQVLERYARRHHSVDEVLLSCFCLGLSTRKAASVLAPILGESVSAATISRIAQDLDHAVAGYHQRRLSDDYLYLFLDGIVLKSKGAAKVQKKILLCAFGIRKDGVREMIDFYPASSESQAAWEAFLRDLYRRGLRGGSTLLVATDGGAGLHGALQIVYPRVPLQRCWAHKTRNLLDKVKKRDWKVFKTAIHKISHAKNRREATKAYWRLALRWRETYPRAVTCLEKDLEQLLTFFRIPQEDLWSRLRSTNLIERSFVEVRRRTRPMGVFTNPESLQRIVFAVFFHLNNQWSKQPLKEITQKT